jgi:hypothetical protein
MPTKMLIVAPGSFRRIHDEVTRVDKAVAALFDQTKPHVPADVKGDPAYQRLVKEMMVAFRRLDTALAIELQAEQDIGPESVTAIVVVE